MPASRRLFVLLLFTCLGAFAHAGPLRIVTDPWAPYVFVENGQARGLDYDASVEVFKRLGVEVHWDFMPWKRCLIEMENGQADAVLDIFMTEERRPRLHFADEPLSSAEFVLFYDRARPYPFNRLTDLQGLKVGTSPGYWYSDSDFRTSELFTREPAPSHEANLGKLVRDRVDLVVNDRRAGLWLAQHLGLAEQVAHHPRPVGEDPLYLAFRRPPELGELAQRFAEELRRFKREPAYATLQARYPVREQAWADGLDRSTPLSSR